MVHERFASTSGWVPPWIRHEHLARYAFVSGFVAGRVVVDCASGDGTGAGTFARSGAAQVRAFDLSKEAVENARAAHPGVQFEQGDALHLPLPDGAADVFVSLETIEHLAPGIASAEAFVDQVGRILKPEGIFICSTPDRSVYNPGKPPEARPWNPFHVREYSRDEFTTMLERRFQTVRMYAQNPRPRLLTTALTLLGRAPGHLAVRCTQAMKVLSAPFDRPSRHAVVPAEAGRQYEYLVAVCERPKARDP